MKETIKEYAVPFKLEGCFVLRAKNIADLKKKMDAIDTTDLIKTAHDIQINAYPDRAEKLAEFSSKIKIKKLPNNQNK